MDDMLTVNSVYFLELRSWQQRYSKNQKALINRNLLLFHVNLNGSAETTPPMYLLYDYAIDIKLTLTWSLITLILCSMVSVSLGL